MKIIVLKDVKQVPWKNGLGSSTEYLINPPAVDVRFEKFNYRMSSALVTAESTFSYYKGYKRILILLNGEMTLTHKNSVGKESSIELKRLTSYSFSGDDLTTAKVTSEGELLDLNFIYRAEKFEVKSKIITGMRSLTIVPRKTYFLFSPESKFYLDQQEIPPNKVVVVSAEKPMPCQVFVGTTILFELTALEVRSKP